MKTITKAISILFPSLFTDGDGWLECRELTIEDFDITISEIDVDGVKRLWENHRFGNIYKTIKLRLKDNIIADLDAVDFFVVFSSRVKFSELDGERQDSYVTFHESLTHPIEDLLATGTGGVFRKKDVVSKLIEDGIKDINTNFEFEKESIIIALIGEANKRISDRVSSQNDDYKKSVLSLMTKRERITDALKGNIDIDAILDLKNEHDVVIEGVNDTIEELKVEIKRLEVLKTDRFIETTRTLFGEDIEKLPPEVRDALEDSFKNKTAFQKLNRGFN